MRTYLVLFFSIVIFICACTKSTSPPTPPVFQDAAVTVSEPADSSYFPKGSPIIIQADVSGPLDDYSFLSAYVIDFTNNIADTVARTSVSKDGSISATIPNTLEPGLRRFEVFVLNPFQIDQATGSELFSIFIGTPPPVEITMLEKDDVSNIIHWSRTGISNFAAYEIYASRTDQMPDRPPYPDGELIARITNIDSLSFRHDSIYFFYRYSYMVKLITDEDYNSNSERKDIISGTFIQLSDFLYDTHVAIFDPQRQRIYLPGNFLKIVDPLLMEVEDSVEMPAGLRAIAMNSSGNSIDCIIKTDYNMYRSATLDINGRQLTLRDEFRLPTETIMGVMDNFVIYISFIRTTSPFTPITLVYNITNGQTDTIRYGNTRAFKSISDNRLVLTDYSDSFFVYKQAAGNFTLINEGRVSGVGFFSNSANVHESNQSITIGNVLFDQSFNKVHEVGFEGGDNPNFFIGISNDGNYVVTRHNEIINTSTWQIERVYGDGFGTVTYFSSNNNVLFHFTEGSLSARWNPPPKLFRYPWR